MAEEAGGQRRWLRPLGLFGLVVALAVVRPLVLVGVPFALLALFASGRRVRALVVAAAILALIFAGGPAGGLWYLERGWAIVVAGWFVALTLAWPGQPFVPRAIASLAGAAAWCAVTLVGVGGWDRAQALVTARIEEGAASTLELLGAAGDTGGAGGAFAETVQRTAEIQGVLFPSLLGLATLAALGVAWWLYLRIATGWNGGLAPLRSFRFPDPLIWVLIGGLALLLLGGWSEGWGRLGTNLAVFMGGLYALRGTGVLLFLAGRVTWPGAILVGVAAIVVPPLLLASAMAVGVGDSWFDLRARGARQKDLDED